MNLRRTLTGRTMITLLLIVHVIALPLFPPESFAATSQEWWLPVLLLVMVVVADVQLILRQTDLSWPWHLISFANGFNILSRIMMVWSHATIPHGETSTFNAPYVILTLISIAISTFMLIYVEWPEVRLGLLKELKTKSSA